MSRRPSMSGVVLGVVLAGCGGGGAPDGGAADASCQAPAAVVTPPRTAGPYLTLRARGTTTGAPVPGVVLAVDQRGTRVETVTDDAGVALVDLPDWDAGAVDVTAFLPSGATPHLDSYLGIPRGDTFAFEVLVPPAATTTRLSGQLLGRAAEETVLLDTAGGLGFWQEQSSSYTLTLEGQPAPVEVLALTFTASGSSSSLVQDLRRWVRATLPGPDGGSALDLASLPALPTASATLHLAVPGGDTGPLAGLDAYGIAFGPALDDAHFEGVDLGFPTRLAPNLDGTVVDIGFKAVNVGAPAWLVPYRTQLWVGDLGPAGAFSFLSLPGLPVDGQTYTLPTPPSAAIADGGLRLPAPFVIGPAPAGAVRTVRLFEQSTGGGRVWRVWALDGRETVSVPAPPAAARCEADRLAWAAPGACLELRNGACLQGAYGKLRRLQR